MRMIYRMWNGTIPLSQVFWLHGITVLVVVTAIFQFTNLGFFIFFFGGFLFVGVLAAFAVAYQLLVSIAIWRSVNCYTGTKIWAVLARVVVGLSLFMLVVGIPLAGYLYILNTPDASRNSANASQSLNRISGYPLTGFWKGHCFDDYGLLIEPTKEAGIYSVSPCGVGGCYRPNTFHPNSKILNDPMYHVIDNDTIVVIEYGGESYTQYIRCE